MIQTLVQTLQEAVAKVMISLESDQVVSQMRNDASLYSFKLQHMKQIVHEEFNVHGILSNMHNENVELTKKCHHLESTLQRMREQYASEIEDIESKCKEYIVEKEKERMRMQQGHQAEKQSLLKTVKQLQVRQGAKASQWDRREREMQERDRKKRQESAKLSEQQQETIRRMRQDMQVIKESWQRRCEEVERKTRQECDRQMIDFEEQMKKELTFQIENAQLGREVVVTSALEDKKLQMMETALKAKNAELAMATQARDKAVDDALREVREMRDELARVNGECAAREKRSAEEKKELQMQISRKLDEIDKCQSSQALALGEVKKCRATLQESGRENRKCKEEVNFYIKKMDSFGEEIAELKRTQQQKQNKLMILQQRDNTLTEQANTDAALLLKHSHSLTTANIKINSLQEKVAAMESKESQLRQQKDESTSKMMRRKEQIKRVSHKMERLGLEVGKVRKQCELVKQNLKYVGQIYKTKMSTLLLGVAQQMGREKEALESKYHTRMNSLLDETEQTSIKDKDSIEILLRERENMKAELNELEHALDDRGRDHEREKEKLLQRQEETFQDILRDAIEKERNGNRKLLQQMERMRSTCEDALLRSQREVAKCLLAFTDKWANEIKRVQDECTRKDRKIRELSDHLQNVCDQSEKINAEEQAVREELRKVKKKHEQFKGERDLRMEDLLKRLELESKQKMQLEREVRAMRGLVRETSTKTLQGPNFSFTDREAKSTCKGSPLTDRERELVQIRDMIAKTYKYVGDEKDGGRSSKRLL